MAMTLGERITDFFFSLARPVLPEGVEPFYPLGDPGTRRVMQYRRKRKSG